MAFMFNPSFKNMRSFDQLGDDSGDDGGFDWGNTSLSLSDLYQGGIGILSQVLAGNKGQQVRYDNNGSLVPVSSAQNSGFQTQNAQTQALLTQQALLAQQQKLATTGIGSGIDGIFNWVGQNPMTVLLIGAGAFLLFREPPRGRR